MSHKTKHETVQAAETPLPGTDLAGTVWAKIKQQLMHQREQINEEIRNYPPPIPACDQQYNHLLEQRTGINRELTRLDEAVDASRADKDPAGRIERFIQASSYVDDDIAEEIRALLTRAR
jgi:hypothetical protein